MRIVNLTPHALNLMPAGPTGPVITIPPSGQVARCAVDRVQVDTVTVDGIAIPVNRTQFGTVTGLPDPSQIPFGCYHGESPNGPPRPSERSIVNDAVQDDQGRIVGAKTKSRV